MSSTVEGEHHPRARKEEILEVATHLFAERGYEGTSMSDVAERVGIRKASLFYHFTTKDSLYEAVVDRLVKRLGLALEGVYGGTGTFAERLEAAADALTTALGQRPYAARLLLRESIGLGPALRGRSLEPMLAALEAGAAFVRAGQDAGEFLQGDAKQMVLTTLGAHVLPFALGELVERYVGTALFEAGFVAARRAEVCRAFRKMMCRAA